MPDLQPSPQLDYAPRPPVHRRKWLRRAIWTIAAVAVLVVSAFVSRWAYERAMLYHWSNRCMTFTQPPGTVAYQENPPPAAWAAVANSRDYTNVVDGSTGTTLAIIMRPRAQWETSIRTEVGLNQFGSVFLHACNAGRGDRIVCVTPMPDLLYRRNPSFPPGIHDFQVDVMRPGTFLSKPQRLRMDFEAVVGFSKYPYGTVRFFAGQPDRADASHFTIDYQTPPRPRDDRRVSEKQRHGPAHRSWCNRDHVARRPLIFVSSDRPFVV